MEHIEAFILAGGASSRMGIDKSELLIQNLTFTQRIADTLFKITDSVTVVGRQTKDSRLKVAMDIYPHWGALGGLHAALTACRADWAIVVACDLPFVTPALFASLTRMRADYDAIVPRQRDERLQPLCAIYRKEPCLSRASELIEQGKRRPFDLIESINTFLVPFSMLANLDQSEKFFVNINTPEDYYEATRQPAP